MLFGKGPFGKIPKVGAEITSCAVSLLQAVYAKVFQQANVPLTINTSTTCYSTCRL